MTNRLMSPLFSVEEIDTIDQEVTEAKAIKNISTKAALNTPLPDRKKEDINLDVDFFNDDLFPTAISKLLNNENKSDKPNIEIFKSTKNIELQKIETVDQEYNKIPDFLLRENDYTDIGKEKLKEYVASKRKWSWKIPYSLLFVASLMTWALLNSNYSLLIFAIAALPLFYTKKS